MLKDIFNDFWLVNKADDPHLALAVGTDKGICFIDLSDEVGPSSL